ncbi:MAG: aminodeoxychorismate/anthranilate synthase component II [Cryomorphaceae bacterium]|nr:aminodeoxychorismate/anthranilate synthase component II [Cryomorphaceae bacterium]
MAILLFDNYDSFTYNLYHYIDALGVEVEVVTNDVFIPADWRKYEAIVISPGPGLPEESGCLMALIELAYGRIPILGVCMGMQAMAQYCGHELYNLEAPLHGVARGIQIDSGELFRGVPKNIQVGLYHSWAVKPQENSAWSYNAFTDSGILMAMENPEKKAYAVQFHPESVLTEHGRKIMENFVRSVKK